MRRSYFLISFLLGFLLLASAGRARADGTYSFSIVPPSGAASGSPGSTIGWGYSITNNSTTDLLVTLDANEDSVLDSLGTVTAIFDAPIIAPNTTATESYDSMAMLGLIELTLDPGLPVGTTATGHIFMVAMFCTALDPTTGMPVNCGKVINESVSYNVTVTPPPGTGVPEPSSMLLLFSGLCGIGMCIWHRQRYSGWRAAQ